MVEPSKPKGTTTTTTSSKPTPGGTKPATTTVAKPAGATQTQAKTKEDYECPICLEFCA